MGVDCGISLLHTKMKARPLAFGERTCISSYTAGSRGAPENWLLYRSA